MKKIFNFIKSMTFAVIILLVLGVLSIIGTIIPQNESPEFYINKYGSKADLIQTLSLNQVFTSYWYLVLLGLLCLSLLLCVVFRIKPLIESFNKNKGLFFVKFSPWLLHLGMLLIIVFFSLGNLTAFETSFYNVPGTVNPVAGTELIVSVDDFKVEVDGGNVVNYLTKARFFNGSGKLMKEADIRVNHPASVDGFQFSQTSFGYALDAQVFRHDEEIGTELLFQDEVVSADHGKFYIELLNFFPDFLDLGDRVVTKSQELNNPVAYVNLFYMERLVVQDFVKLNEPIEVGEYKTILKKPQYYTLLAVRKDPYIPGVIVGVSLFLIGLFGIFLLPSPENKTVKEEEVFYD